MRTTPVGQTSSHASPHGGGSSDGDPSSVELFGTEFATAVWDRRACELDEGPAPLFDEREVMAAICRYRHELDQIRQLGDRADVVTAVDGRRFRDPLDDLLAQDDDLDDYLGRVDSQYDGSEWAVAYFGLHAASTAIWDRAKSFADRLAEAIGRRPGGRVDVDCFLGRYRSTHTGVHVDHAHNFGTTLRSGKVMLTWPGDRADLQGLGPDEFEAHRHTAIALRNLPGIVGYFPEDHFHVAETPDRPSVNVNITFWEHEDTVGPHVRYLLSRLTTEGSSDPTPSSSGERALVGVNADNLAALREIVGSGEWERRMVIAQLRWETSGHLGVARPVAASVRVAEQTARAPFASVQWTPVSDGRELVVAANGHCAAFRPSDALDRLLSDVVRGARIDSASVLRARSSEEFAERARLFTALVEWGVLT